MGGGEEMAPQDNYPRAGLHLGKQLKQEQFCSSKSPPSLYDPLFFV